MKLKDEAAFLADLERRGVPYTLGKPMQWTRPPGVHGGIEYRVELSTDLIQVVSEANRRDHWAQRRKRRKAQTDTLALLMRNHVPPGPEHPDKYRVTFTRYGYRKMDSDNLAGSFKGLRDWLAAWLGYDDGDDRLIWEYRQEKCKPGIGLLVEGVP